MRATTIHIAASLFLTVAASERTRADEPYRAVQEVLSATETVVGEPLRYPSAAAPLVHAVIITLRPEEATARHRHGVPLFAYILDGELSVNYGPRGQRVYRAGDALMEAMDVPHVGRNTG